MTWTKIGDEFSDAARDLTDAAYRTHTEALLWSNRRLMDLVIPKRDLKRFAETADPDTAAKELIETGWWQDCGDEWWIGCRFADCQLERSVVERKREQSAVTTRRHRLHKAGDHSLCNPSRCDSAGDASPDVSPGTGRDGSGTGKDAKKEEPYAHARESCAVTGCDQPPRKSCLTCFEHAQQEFELRRTA